MEQSCEVDLQVDGATLHLLCFYFFGAEEKERGEKQGAEEMGVLMCCGFLALGIDAMLSNTIKVLLLNGFLLAYFFYDLLAYLDSY